MTLKFGGCSVTGVLAGLGRMTGTPLSRLKDVNVGEVGLPGPPKNPVESR